MKKNHRRTPKDYDGSQLTTHHLGSVAAAVLRDVASTLRERPDLVLSAWPRIIGPTLSTMTEAVSFINGIVLVKVKNQTLFSLLGQRDKPKILKTLRQQLPNTLIRDIVFRMN